METLKFLDEQKPQEKPKETTKDETEATAQGCA
jgi:hypothetical protein